QARALTTSRRAPRRAVTGSALEVRAFLGFAAQDRDGLAVQCLLVGRAGTEHLTEEVGGSQRRARLVEVAGDQSVPTGASHRELPHADVRADWHAGADVHDRTGTETSGGADLRALEDHDRRREVARSSDVASHERRERPDERIGADLEV